MQTIDRSDPLWKACFFEAWKRMLARIKDDDEASLLQGTVLAERAAGLADSALHVASGKAKGVVSGTCAECNGVGCPECNWGIPVGRVPAPVFAGDGVDRAPATTLVVVEGPKQ